MSGDTECVQLLLDFGHQVDCVDKCGWPPLLYANFKAHESCVLALMKPKPEQVFVLGTLLRKARNELDKKRTVKVHVHVCCIHCTSIVMVCLWGVYMNLSTGYQLMSSAKRELSHKYTVMYHGMKTSQENRLGLDYRPEKLAELVKNPV